MREKKCVLICDDDQAILEACSIILQEEYEVVTVRECENIVEDVLKTQPDIILMDLLIPGRGDNAVNLIHQTEKIKHIPVIVFSALSDAKDICEKVKADAIIEKPFDIKTLLETVKEYVL